LELLKILPDSRERAQQELTLQIALGAPLMATKGFTAPEVESVYTRARELCQQIGDPLQHFSVLDGLWSFHHMRADLEITRAIAHQALTLAHQTHNTLFLARAHNRLGTVLSFLGDQASAWDQLEQGLTLVDSQPLRSQDFILVSDPALNIRSHAARLLWLLGFPDQALKRGAEAVILAREQGQAASLCIPLTFAAWCHLFRGKADKARELADTLITVATEHGFAYHSGMGMVMLGRALVQQGQLEEGLVQFRQGWTEQQATGSRLNRPYNLAFLAETYGKMRQTTEGLSLVTEALSVVHATQEAWWEAELYRLKGQLTLQQFQVSGFKFQVADLQPLTLDPQAEAEACFLKAIEIARRQSAKSLELRAATSLARLWQQQGKQHEAHKLLSDIYGWFTEGFDTKDLQETKTLLESSSS
jgi:predicted ATPase